MLIETNIRTWTAEFGGMARGRFALVLRPERHTDPRVVLLTARTLRSAALVEKAIEFWTEGECVPSERIDLHALRVLLWLERR